jgi:hypothetical protein
MVLKFFFKASAVSIRLLNPLPRPLSDRGSRFRNLYQTAEAASAASIRPRKPLPGLYQTAEAASAVSIRPRNPSQSCHVGFSGLYQTAEAASAVSIRLLKQLQRSLSGRGSRFWRLQSRFSRRIRIHIRNGFSP